MLAELFYKLREFQVPVSVTEYLTLLNAMEKGVSGLNIDSFYFLARSALVKDERFFDRFDVVFGNYFKGQEALFIFCCSGYVLPTSTSGSRPSV